MNNGALGFPHRTVESTGDGVFEDPSPDTTWWLFVDPSTDYGVQKYFDVTDPQQQMALEFGFRDGPDPGTALYEQLSVWSLLIEPTAAAAHLDIVDTANDRKATLNSQVSTATVAEARLHARIAEDPGFTTETYFDLIVDADGVRFEMANGGPSPIKFNPAGTQLGFFDQTPVARPTITGDRSADLTQIVTDLLAALDNLGLITDSTVA